jgi:Protein of unknown function (DUF2806)
MSETPVPTNLPTLSEKIWGWFGLQVPSIPLPQTVKNLDKALGRLIAVGGENLASRMEHDTSRRQARAEAEADIIDVSGGYLGSQITDQGPFTERALEFAFGDSVLKQSNREKIARLAIEDFTTKSAGQTADAAAEIDEDWLNSFSDLASQKSNAEIQGLWARILSGKIRQPSSFSLKSLELLASLDTRDAHLIHKVLSYSINRSFIYKAPMFNDLTRFITGEDLGALSGTAGGLQMGFDVTSGPSQTGFLMSGVLLIVTTPDKRRLDIPCFMLTRFGKELLALSEGFDRDTKYEQEFIDFLKKTIPGATVRRDISGGPLEDV